MLARIEQLESRWLLSAASVLRIDCGGAGLSDSIGRAFAPDSGFVGGQQAQATGFDVLETQDDPLFLTFRTGSQFSYSWPIDNGNYTLWLEFVEPGSIAAGERAFDVSAEGAEILDSFDIVQSAGAPQKAIAGSFDVTIADGSLDLAFTGVIGEAIVSAIVLLPTDVPAEAQPYSWLELDDPQRVLLSQQHLYNIGSAIFIYASEHRGRFPPDLATAFGVDLLGMDTFGNPRTSTMLPRGERSALEQSAWVGARPDYIYLGAGGNHSFPADAVLAYENPQREYGDIGILWGDAHASVLDRAAAAALIGFENVPPTDPPPAPPPIVPADPDILTSADHLHQLVAAAYTYANEHAGRFPTSLGLLFELGYVSDLGLYVNPRGSTQLPPANATFAEKLAWVDATTDYLFATPGQRYSSIKPDDVVMCENPAGFADGINVLLADGRLEFREQRWAQESLHRRRPTVAFAGLSYNYGPPSVTFGFAEPGVSAASVQAGDVVLRNLSTGQTISTSTIAVSYDVVFRILRLTFPSLPFGALPDGNYRATLAAGSVQNALGIPLPSDYTCEFHVLAGDANRDRVVDITDLSILATNWQGQGKSFSEGDFNYDNTVDISDLAILATNWQLNVPVPAPVVRAPARIARPIARDVFSDKRTDLIRSEQALT